MVHPAHGLLHNSCFQPEEKADGVTLGDFHGTLCHFLKHPLYVASFHFNLFGFPLSSEVRGLLLN